MKRSLQLLIKVLEDYTLILGQKVNHHKSGFLTYATLSDLRKRFVAQVTGFRSQAFPMTYLGCPLYSGRWKKSYFAAICTSLASRVLSWKERLLSVDGKLVMIRSVLAPMPIYIFPVSNHPRGIFDKLEQILANFLWSSDFGPRFHWIKWIQLCKPIEEGGVGVRSLQNVFDAFSLKLWSNFRQRRSLWADFMHLKYCPDMHPCYSNFSSGQSHTWKRMMNAQVIAEKHIWWSLGSGSTSFWHDNWMETGHYVGRWNPFRSARLQTLS